MSCIIAVMALSLPGLLSIGEKMEAEGGWAAQEREIFLAYSNEVLKGLDGAPPRENGPIPIESGMISPSALKKLGLGNFAARSGDGWIVYVFAHPKSGEIMARLSRSTDFLFKREDRLIDGNGVPSGLPADAASAVPDGSRVIIERRRL